MSKARRGRPSRDPRASGTENESLKEDPLKAEAVEVFSRAVDALVGPDATFAQREAALLQVAQEVVRRAARERGK